MFILAILSSAAGVQLLPVPDAIVSPVFIPRSCQSSSQTAEEMLRPRWESGAGEAARPPACLPACWVPWEGASPGGAEGLWMAEDKGSLDQCLKLTLEMSRPGPNGSILW